MPTGAGVETRFWEAVRLQQVGGATKRWKKQVDFYADILDGSPADAGLKVARTRGAEPMWLGLDASWGPSQPLFVSASPIVPVQPGHPFERHPGVRRLPDSQVVGLRLTLSPLGTYFEQV